MSPRRRRAALILLAVAILTLLAAPGALAAAGGGSSGFSGGGGGGGGSGKGFALYIIIDEQPIAELHDVGLVDGGDLAPVVQVGKPERILHRAPRLLLRDHLRGVRARVSTRE